MSLGKSLSFSAMLEKYFSKIIKLGVRVCVCWERGEGVPLYNLIKYEKFGKKCKLTSPQNEALKSNM